MTDKILPIIIDTDMGWDDVMAILLMMKNPGVKILGITVTGCGETYLGDGVEIARGLLALDGNPAPVCAGADHPSSYDHVFPGSFRANMNDVMGLRLTLPASKYPPDPRNAVQLMKDLLEHSQQPVTIISIGGLTNITALLAEASPKLLSKIGNITIMGGAVDVPGNVADLNDAKPQWRQGPIYSSNKTAEWNLFIDALAAQTAFRWTAPALPLTLVPLDACNAVMLTEDYAKVIVAKDDVAQFLKSVIEAKVGPSSEGGDVSIFDPLATVYGVGLLHDCTVETMVLDVKVVDTTTSNTCGQTVRSSDTAIPAKKVVMTASATEFMTVFTKLANAPVPKY